MMLPSKLQILLVIVLFTPLMAMAEVVPRLQEVPEALPEAQRAPLLSLRAELLQKRGLLKDRFDNQAGRCSKVAQGTDLWKQCSQELSLLESQKAQHIAESKKFNLTIDQMFSDRQEKVKACEKVAEEAQMERRQIEELMRSNQLNQQELSDWTKLNAQAQKDAVITSVKFVLGEYAAGAGAVRESATKLEQQATTLAQKARASKRFAARTKSLAKLDAVLGRLAPMQIDLALRTATATGLDAEKTWRLSQDTMWHQFRVARKQNQELREVLNDPEFKEAFTGDDKDAPGMEVVTALTDQTVEETANFLTRLGTYEKFTGQAVRAAEFIRDAWYDALLSYLSTERVLQANDVAGDLAIAAGFLQRQSGKTVRALSACRQAGLLK